MNPKALMFGVVGLIVFGGMTMAWVGHDMNAINAENRAKRQQECQAAAASAPVTAPTDVTAAAATPATTATTTTPTAAPNASSTPRTPQFVASCHKLGIELQQQPTPGAIDPTTAGGQAPQGGTQAPGITTSNTSSTTLTPEQAQSAALEAATKPQVHDNAAPVATREAIPTTTKNDQPLGEQLRTPTYGQSSTTSIDYSNMAG